MKSSSPEPRLLREDEAGSVAVARLGGELRTGRWTRLGGSSVLGDVTTEHALGRLAERAVQAGRAQGYAQGWAEGRRTGEAEAAAAASRVSQQVAQDERTRQQAHAVSVRALESAARELQARFEEACSVVEARVVDAALQLAQAIVGRELAVATNPGSDAVRRLLRVLPHEATTFTVRLHPEDVGRLDPVLLEEFSASVVPDPDLAPGDAVAETDTMVIDAAIDAALARVRGVLAP